MFDRDDAVLPLFIGLGDHRERQNGVRSLMHLIRGEPSLFSRNIMSQRVAQKRYHLFCATIPLFTVLFRNQRVKKESGAALEAK